MAGAIAREGGRDIQNECDTSIIQNGPLLEGHVFVTGAGRSSCSQVIHAVGPRRDPAAEKKRQKEEVTQEERYLKQVIVNFLAEAKNHTLLAIQGVSCDIYGSPRDLCANFTNSLAEQKLNFRLTYDKVYVQKLISQTVSVRLDTYHVSFLSWEVQQNT